MMKIIGFFTTMLLSVICANAQLKLKATETNSSFGARTIINETTGVVLPENLVPNSEEIIHTTDNFIFTRPTDKFKTLDEETLKKYQLTNGIAREIASLRFPTYALITFFQNGAFVLMEGGEGFGRLIKMYSNDFQLLHTVTPFTSGMRAVQYHSSGDVVVVGVNQRGYNVSKLIAFNSAGKLLFEKQINVQDGEIAKVLCSSDFYGVYSYNVSLNSIRLSIYDKNAIELWSSSGVDMIQQWSFVHPTTPVLVIGTFNSLFLYDAKNGRPLAEKKLSAIYEEAGAKKLSKTGIAEIIDIQSIPYKSQVGVLLSEHTSSYESTNNILYVFNQTSLINDQKVILSDTKGSMKMKLTAKELMIIKDKELLKYEYNIEK